MRLIGFNFVPREVADHQKLADHDDDDANLCDDNGRNKQKFNEINWFEVAAKGVGLVTHPDLNCGSDIHRSLSFIDCLMTTVNDCDEKWLKTEVNFHYF